jgi:hypothetical protein
MVDGETKKTVTFIAKSEQARDEWMSALKQFFELSVDGLQIK